MKLKLLPQILFFLLIIHTFELFGQCPTPNIEIINPPKTVCVGVQVTFYATDLPDHTYSWGFSSDATVYGPANESSITLSWNTAGPTGISVIATNSCGNSSPTDISSLPNAGIQVQDNSDFALSSIYGESEVCSGQYKYSVGYDPNISNITWEVSGGGVVEPLYNPNIDYANVAKITWSTAPGTYTATVTATNTCTGVTKTSTMEIIVASGVKPTTNLINGIDQEIFCIPKEGVTKSYSVSQQSGISFEWSIWPPQQENTLASNGNTATVEWVSPSNGWYSIEVTPYRTTCRGEKTKLYTLATESPQGTLNITPDQPCIGSTLNLEISELTIEANALFEYRHSINNMWTAWQPINSSSFYISNQGTYEFRSQLSQVFSPYCNGVSNTVSLTIENPLPTITPQTSQPICSSSVGYIPYTSFGTPDQYRIDWTTLTDVPWTTLPSSPIMISELPTIAGTYNGTLYVRNTTTGCESLGAPISITIESMRDASFSGLNTSYCINSSPATLSPTISGGTFSGPGISSNTFNPTSAGIGTHTITYTITENGCTNSSSQEVNVIALPNPSFSGLNSTYCINASSSTLAPATSGGTFSGQGISGNSFNPTSAGIGTHTITYTITVNGCINSSSQQVTVNALPNASFSGLNPSYCSNASSVVLSPLVSGGTFSGPGISGNTFNPASAGAGTHTITYTIAQNGCTNLSSQQVTVLTMPDASFTGLQEVYCTDVSPSTLTPAIQGGLFSGTGISGNIFDPVVAKEGSHTISYTLTSNGCSNNSSQQVHIAAPIVSIIPAATTTFCQGGSVRLNISFTEMPVTSYQWKKNGVNISGATSYYYNASQSGNYSITLTTMAGCTYTTPAVSVTMLPAPRPYISTSYDLCTYGYVRLTANGATGASSYTWSTGSTTTVNYKNFYQAGTYNVRANYPNGCSATSYNVTIDPCGPPPPCDPYGRVPQPCDVYIIDDNTDVEVNEPTVYPNPANADITLHLPYAVKVDLPVKIFSQLGVLQLSSHILKNDSKTTINTRNLSNGIYIIQLETPEGKPILRKKVLVVHQ